MDNSQIGTLIRTLRLEQNMTQLQLANRIGVTDRAVSKWERGLGGPDISLLRDLSEVLAVNIEKLLAGSLQPNDNDRGNMRRMRFHVCPNCGGILTATGKSEMYCGVWRSTIWCFAAYRRRTGRVLRGLHNQKRILPWLFQ